MYKLWGSDLPSVSQNCGMVQGPPSFHVWDVHIGPILQQKFTSNQWTLWKQNKETTQHQISRIKPNLFCLLTTETPGKGNKRELLPYQLQTLLGHRIPNKALTGKKIFQKQPWKNTVNTTSASHYHSLGKQAAQKEQWCRNIIISLALLPHLQCCISHTPSTAWMSGVALFSSTLTQFTSAPWANASAMWGRFFSKAARYNCNPGLGCLESQNTGDSCLSPSKKKKKCLPHPCFYKVPLGILIKTFLWQ